MAKDKSKIDMERILDETEGAYSRERYGAVAWRKSIDNLAKLGYTEDEIIWILNSKYMRWAADHYDEGKEYGELSGDEIVKYDKKEGIDLKGMYKEMQPAGEEIKDQYKGKYAGNVWDSWTKDQRMHFLYDHQDITEIGFINKKYIDLDLSTQIIIRNHVSEGQYAGGGSAHHGGAYAGGGKDERYIMAKSWYEEASNSELTKIIEGFGYKPYKFRTDAGNYPSFDELGQGYSIEAGNMLRSDIINYVHRGYTGGSAHHGEAYAGSMEGRRYRLGDKWSEDFDYRGMLETGLNVNPGWKTEDLEKLFESFESVNYHTEAAPLHIAILHRKGITKTPDYYPDEPEYRNAQVAINVFHDRVRGALAGYAGGGSAHHGMVEGINYENEGIDGYYVKNNLTPKQLNEYVKFRKEGSFKKQALEMALTTQKERENYAAGGVIEKLKRAIASSKTSPADRDKMREALHKLQLPTPPPKPKPVKEEKKVKPIELPHLQFLTENKIDVKSLPLKTRQKINGIKMLAGKKSDKARDKAKTLSETLIKSIKAGMKPSNKLNDRKKEEIRDGYERRRKAKKAMAE